MANVSICGAFKATVLIEVTEQEAGALEALFSYNVAFFLKTFYEEMGQAYLQPYEEGIVSLHNSRGAFKSALDRLKEAREVFEGLKCATDIPRKEQA